MDEIALKALLENVANGKMTIEDALNKLRILPFEDIGFAKVDHHRSLRNGFPEVIFCQGKSIFHIKDIFKRLMDNSSRNIIATRASKEIYTEVLSIAPEALYYEDARIVAFRRQQTEINNKLISVVSAGTADIPVAEEAAVTAELMGNKVSRIYDVGVAGIHRLFAYIHMLYESNVIIVVAGMEGALASVVGGLVDKPVIAVPTSVGYGANFGGLSALLTMLNSCASGVSVVNIDNGFGAGYLAAMINRL